MTDYDKLNEAMTLRQRTLTKVAWWQKKVVEAEVEIKAQIEASFPYDTITDPESVAE